MGFVTPTQSDDSKLYYIIKVVYLDVSDFCVLIFPVLLVRLIVSFREIYIIKENRTKCKKKNTNQYFWLIFIIRTVQISVKSHRTI